MRIVGGRNFSNVPRPGIKIVGIRAGRLNDRVVPFMNQKHVAEQHRNRHVKIGISRVNGLNGKAIFGQKTIIIGLLVIGGIVSRILAMRRKT